MHEKQVNINEFPRPEEVKARRDARIKHTFGDQHGNTKLMLWSAINSGAVTLPEEAYREFVSIYNANHHETYLLDSNGDYKNKLESWQVSAMERILEQIRVVNPNILLGYLGDLIGDRGSNDLFTLMLLRRLKELGLRVNIVVSNHDMYLLSAYEAAKHVHSTNPDGDFIQQFKQLYHQSANQYPSGLRLIAALEDGIITKSEFCDLMESYKSHLLAIDYSFEKEPTEKLVINTHGAVGLEAIRFYAHKFGINYKDGTARELMTTIDKINHEFKTALERGDEMFRNFNTENILQSADKTLSLAQSDDEERLKAYKKNASENPLLYACEARGITSLRGTNPGKLPVLNKGMVETAEDKPYSVHFVHGHHHKTELSPEHFTSLDSMLGKIEGEYDDGMHKSYIAVSPRDVSVQALITAAQARLAVAVTSKQRAKYLAIPATVVGVAALATILARSNMPKEWLTQGFRETVPGFFNGTSKSMDFSIAVVAFCVIALLALLWFARKDKQLTESEAHNVEAHQLTESEAHQLLNPVC